MLSPTLCPRCYFISCLLSLGCPGIRLSITSRFKILWDPLEKGISPYPSKLWKERKSRKARRRRQGGDKDTWEQEKGNNSRVELHAPVFTKENSKVDIPEANNNPYWISRTDAFQMALCLQRKGLSPTSLQMLPISPIRHLNLQPVKTVRNHALEGIAVWRRLPPFSNRSCSVILSRPLHGTQDQNIS